MCRFFADGKYKVSSTKETSYRFAKKWAEEWFDELRYGKRKGIPIHDKTFSEVSKLFLDYQDRMVQKGDRSSRQAKDYMYRINELNKYFSKVGISKININNIDEYRSYRLLNPKKPVSRNTVKYDLLGLRQVLKFAMNQGWIEILPIFPETKKIESNPRPWFSPEEWKVLKNASFERIKQARGKRQKWEREQLHDFMIFIVHTGVRVEEALTIQFQDCIIEDKENNADKKLRLELKGKTGIRISFGTQTAVNVYERLRKRNNPKKADLLFPKNHRDGLNNLLKETNLKYDRFGNVRNAKSFRSTYIMLRLVKGEVPIKNIAVNCGTSTHVIDKYYAKYLTADMISESLSDLPKT
jgi:integrase